jgi:hypothetical protein
MDACGVIRGRMEQGVRVHGEDRDALVADY